MNEVTEPTHPGPTGQAATDALSCINDASRFGKTGSDTTIAFPLEMCTIEGVVPGLVAVNVAISGARLFLASVTDGGLERRLESRVPRKPMPA